MSQTDPATTPSPVASPGGEATTVAPAENGAAVAAAVRGRDVPCPGCGCNLRDLPGDACPECGKALTVGGLDAKPGWLRYVRANRLGPAAVLGAVWTFAPAICGILLLTYIETVSQTLRGLGPWTGLAVYATVFIIAAGLGFLPTVTQAVLGGWCFGFALGYPAALLGFTGASLVGYAIARTVARDRVEHAIATSAKARAMRDALIGHGFWKTLGLVVLVRLPPNSPFALTNLVLSSTGVPRLAYAIGTMLGMAPRTAVAVSVGANIQTLTRESLQEGGIQKIAMLATSLALFFVLGWIGKRTWDRVTGAQRGAPASSASA